MECWSRRMIHHVEAEVEAERTKASCRRRGKSLTGLRTGRLGNPTASVLAVAATLVASAASSHTSSVPLPPGSDYVIRWFQPHSVRPVANWEIEVTPQSSPAQRFIATAQAMPDDSCWALQVPVNAASNVRVRSVVGSQVSAWTRYTTVPEPGLSVGLLSSAWLLRFLSRKNVRQKRSRRSRSRSA